MVKVELFKDNKFTEVSFISLKLGDIFRYVNYSQEKYNHQLYMCSDLNSNPIALNIQQTTDILYQVYKDNTNKIVAEFKVGDIVQLKSGSPDLVVEYIRYNPDMSIQHLRVGWFNYITNSIEFLSASKEFFIK